MLLFEPSAQIKCDLPRQKLEKIKPVRPNQVTKTADDLILRDEILKMINACKTSRDRAIIATLYEGAFRIDEVAAMTWDVWTFQIPISALLQRILKPE